MNIVGAGDVRWMAGFGGLRPTRRTGRHGRAVACGGGGAALGWVIIVLLHGWVPAIFAGH